MKPGSASDHIQPARRKVIFAFILLAVLGAGCSGPVEGSIDATHVFEDALLTATNAFIQPTPSVTSTLPPTATTTATPEPTLTTSPTEYAGSPPPPLEMFYSDLLRGGTLPQAYLEDTCAYLKSRWDPNNSPPGTVVMPVMFHGITEDSQVLDDNMNIHHSDMVEFLEYAHELGFKTITTQELIGFLEQNMLIPPLSLIIILDDRRPGAVREHFMPFLVEYDWTLTLGWLIGDTDIRPASYLECCPAENFSSLWEQMESYNASGYLDVQSHGNVHNININPYSSDEYILSELNESRRIIQEHFYCKDTITGETIENCQTDQPLAFIWPGGGFTPRGAELARQNGYRIAFTTNPRGPIMYNWIPQAAVYDASTPNWLPEGPVGDPLMTLPRYWSHDAIYRIDNVVKIGIQATAFADVNRQAELDYYAYHCQGLTGVIPALTVP